MKSKAPPFFALWGVPFVLMGLYMILGRFFVDAKQRSRTAYGVTDHQIVIISGILSRNVKSVALKTVTDLTLAEKADGTGTITFGPSHPMGRWFGGPAFPGTPSYSSPFFESIPRVKDVYRTIRQAQG